MCWYSIQHLGEYLRAFQHIPKAGNDSQSVHIGKAHNGISSKSILHLLQSSSRPSSLIFIDFVPQICCLRLQLFALQSRSSPSKFSAFVRRSIAGTCFVPRAQWFGYTRPRAHRQATLPSSTTLSPTTISISSIPCRRRHRPSQGHSGGGFSRVI